MERTGSKAGRLLHTLHTGGHHHDVVLFPGVLGGLNGYSNVVAALRDSCNLYGLRYPFARHRGTEDGVAALGRHSAQAIDGAPMHGSLHLLGWSMGGLVAYECGRYLRQAGRSAASIIIVDSLPGASGGTSGRDEDVRERMWEQFVELKCGHDATTRILQTRAFRRLTDKERFAVIATHEKRWTTVILKPLGLRTSFRLMWRNLLAMERYVPQGYPGRVHLIVSRATARDVESGWGGCRTGAWQVLEVNGDHLTSILYFAIAPILQIIAGTAPGS